MDRAQRWAIVLAAGDGTRLRPVTTGADGVAVPKQYFRGPDGRTPLELALARAGRLVGDSRVVVVVAAEHERWWSQALAHRPADLLVVQPRNKGTAAGILLPLLSVLGRDSAAQVLITPADHHVEHELPLASAVERAFAALDREASADMGLVLLGMAPDAPVPDYGWIVPGAADAHGLSRVARFVEKPGAERAAELQAEGGLWNSFLFVAAGQALLRLFAARTPQLLDGLLRAAFSREAGALERFYTGLAPQDFSRDLLQGAEAVLRVCAVPPCGWTDLGTPERYLACLGAPAVAPARRATEARDGRATEAARAFPSVLTAERLRRSTATLAQRRLSGRRLRASAHATPRTPFTSPLTPAGLAHADVRQAG